MIHQQDTCLLDQVGPALACKLGKHAAAFHVLGVDVRTLFTTLPISHAHESAL